MFNEKPYVVPQCAVVALFGTPEVDAAIARLTGFFKGFMEVESGFLDLDAAMGDVATVAVFEGSSWRHLTAEVDRDGVANDNVRRGKGHNGVAA